MAFAAAANVTDARLNWGKERIRSLAFARAAGPMSLAAIRTENRSGASSTAETRKTPAVATSVAQRRGSDMRRKIAASDDRL